jgi:hypothetical protein
MVTLFFCFKLNGINCLRTYLLRVKQLIFLTFYLKTNKVKYQIYTKLTVKKPETVSKIGRPLADMNSIYQILYCIQYLHTKVYFFFLKLISCFLSKRYLNIEKNKPTYIRLVCSFLMLNVFFNFNPEDN